MLSALLWNLLLTTGLAIVLAALCYLPSLRRRPALRHWLWLLLLVKLVTPPLIPIPLLPAVAAGNETATIATPPSEPTEHRESVWDMRDQANPVVDEAVFAPAGGNTSEVAPQELQSRMPVVLLGGLLAVSLIGTGVLWTIQGFHAARLYRWLKRAGTEDSLLAESCAAVASSLAIRGVVRSRTVHTRTTPLLWAWHRPMVVVPRQLIDDLSPQQLRSIIAHELAHLVRRDHWANVFVFIVKGLLWWNPVVWWADRELRAAQELCCDAIAMDRCNTDRRSYATTLLKALDFIQMEPLAPHAVVAGMGSSGSLLTRFEMIGETQLSYRLSRWTFLTLLVLAIPLLCIPVRGQEKGGTVPATPAVSDAGAAADAGDKKEEEEEPAKAEPAKTGPATATESIASKIRAAAEKDVKAQTETVEEIPGLDPKILELGEAVKKRMSAWTDEETLTLKEGQTGRMKIKKNVTPVAEILITPHFVEKETKLGMEGVDAAGKKLAGTATMSLGAPDGQLRSDGLGTTFRVDGEDIMSMIQWKATRQGDDSVVVEAKALFMRVTTPAEIEAMLLTMGKRGRVQADFTTIHRWMWEYKNRTGHYPKNLGELNKPLPKDFYSPTGEDYHYAAQRNGFVLSSCGSDGIYGNDDDQMMIEDNDRHEVRSGVRRSMRPLPKEKDGEPEVQTGTHMTVTVTENKDGKTPTETIVGERPRGNCSISGKVVSAATGEPVVGARMYLHYNVTGGSIFINTASDGTFVFKDIPKGPFSLQLSLSPGYQDIAYNPDGKPGQFPPFLLEEGENRSGIVLKAKRACRISGKVSDENGDVPENIGTLTVLAWFENDNGKGYKNRQAMTNRSDGSYSIDGLNGKPAYVMAIDWQAGRVGRNRPPVYYPGVFSRSDAKQITFDEKQDAENIDITLKREGGLVLEGTVLDEDGKPVPEAFVVVHRRDMHFDFVTTYTDEQGRYQIQGLGDGEFLVHVDAVHRGLVRIRTPMDLDRASTRTRRDFTLARGVMISGKFVDEQGNDWQIGQSHGYANTIVKDHREQKERGSFSLTNFRNKHSPKDVQESSGGSFELGEGAYMTGHMIFPTTSTFVIQGMMPGDIKIGFLPQKEGQKVLKILHDGRDVLESGFHTEASQEITDVAIVVGPQ